MPRIRWWSTLTWIVLVTCASQSIPAWGQGLAPSIEAGVHSSGFRIETEAGRTVSARLLDETGRLEGSARQQADGSGHAMLRFTDERSGSPVYLDPGDRMHIDIEGPAQPIEMEVPQLAGLLSAAENRLFGQSGGFDDLRLDLLDPAGAILAEVELNPEAGPFEVDLAGRVDLFHGQRARLRAGDGELLVWTAEVAAPAAELTIGSIMAGRAPVGSRLEICRPVPGGTCDPIGQRSIQGSTDWRILSPYLPSDTEGTSIEVSVTLPGTAASVRIQIEEHRLDVLVLPGADAIRGYGLPDEHLELVLRQDDEVLHRQSVTCDANGIFDLTLPPGLLAGPGSTIELIRDPGEGIRILRRATLMQGIRVMLLGRAIEGTLPADVGATPVTMRVLDAGGTTVREGLFHSDAEGRFGGHWDPVDADRLRPGQTLSFDWGSGDPIRFELPTLEVQIDEGRLVGRSEPGMRLFLARDLGDTLSGPHFAGNDGGFEIEPAPDIELGSDAAGWVFAELRSGHRIYAAWALPRARLELPEGHWTGSCAATGDLAITALDSRDRAQGQRRIDCQASGFSPRGRWSWAQRDGFGLPIDLEVGDRLRIQAAGSTEIELAVPHATAFVDVQADRVRGRLRPPVPAELELLRGGQDHVVAVIPDAGGGFEADFAADWDAMLGDGDARLRASYPHLDLDYRVHLPRLRVDLDTATFEGVLGPDAPIELRAEDAAAGLLVAGFEPDAAGRFAGPLRDLLGRSVLPAAGTELSLRSLAGGDQPVYRFTMPELTVTTQHQEPQASGRATPGGELTLVARTAFRDSGLGNPGLGISGLDRPEINPQGHFVAAFSPALAFLPGQSIRLSYQGDDGLLAERSSREPMLHAQVGGARVCGRADAGARLALAYQPAGQGEWQEAGQSRADGAGAFQFEVPSGESALRLGEGDRLRLLRGGQVISELRIPRFDVDIDWQRVLARGLGPADALGAIDRPVGGCQVERSIAGGLASQRIITGPSGSFEALVSPEPGEDVQIWFLTAEGHRVYRQISRNRFRAYLGTPRIEGRSSPGEIVTATLQSTASDPPTASGQGLADTDGHYALQLDGPGERGHGIPESGLLRVGAGGATTATTLEDLDFDISPETGLFGHAKPGRLVNLELALAGGRQATLELRADDEGSFRLHPADIDPNGAWTLSDALDITAVISNTDGSALARRWSAASSNLESPIWLPLVVIRRIDN